MMCLVHRSAFKSGFCLLDDLFLKGVKLKCWRYVHFIAAYVISRFKKYESVQNYAFSEDSSEGICHSVPPPQKTPGKNEVACKHSTVFQLVWNIPLSGTPQAINYAVLLLVAKTFHS